MKTASPSAIEAPAPCPPAIEAPAPRSDMTSAGLLPSQHEVGVTRRAIVGLLAQHGALSAPAIATHLGLSTVGVRRHLVELVDSGDAVVVQRKARAGRGRPPRVYQLTPQGQDQLGNAYDELALLALRELREFGGEAALTVFARRRADRMLAGIGLDGPEFVGADAASKVSRLAQALTATGYAASATQVSSGVQLCQHHCPVAHVAADFPALCEAETAAFSELLGTHVQRLATIAQGNCVCTTHIPTPAHGTTPVSSGQERASKEDFS